MLLHNHPSGRLEPSGADLDVAARLHDGGVGFGIIDNDATELYVVVEVPRDRAVLRIDPFDVVETLGEHGPVARAAGPVRGPAEPARHGRVHRRRATTTAASCCSRPAPGSGKSFAYLVPALAWARANGERTVVSTNTINLQEQLVGKDLPLLRDALGDDDVHARRSRCSRAGGTISASRGCTRRSARSGRCSSRTSSTS